MKLSVSLPDTDVEILDRYVAERGLGSRSAGLHRAVQLLEAPALEQEYATAWSEFSDSGEARAWESVVHDGVDRDQG